MSSLCIQIQNQLPTLLKICQQSNQCSRIPSLLLLFPHTFRLHTRDTQKRTRRLLARSTCPCRREHTRMRISLVEMTSTSLPRSLCTHGCPPPPCTCLPCNPHTCRSLSCTLLRTGRTPALRRSLHALDMINRSRCRSPTCRCPPRRESTLPGAPCSLLDTCQSSPLHRRCLPAMSSPMHSSCMLPLHWPRKLTSICQLSNHCTLSSQPSRSTFLQDRPHTRCLKHPPSLSNRCLSSTGGSLPMRRCPLSRGTCLLRNLDTRLCLTLPLPHRIFQLHTACRRQRIEPLSFLRKCRQHTGHKSLLLKSLLTTSTCLHHRTHSPLQIDCPRRWSTCRHCTGGRMLQSLRPARGRRFPPRS